MQKVPSPKEPRPKVPEKPKEKPSVFGERGFLPSTFFQKELKKEEYFLKLGIPKEKREKVGKILSDKKIFGELIEKTGEDYLKLKSLIRELKEPGTSSYSEIREVAKKIRNEIGEFKTKAMADILKEKFGL